MIIYHGWAAEKHLEIARSYAPSYTHGAEFGRDMWLRESKPYIIDNGAFSAYKNNREWDSTEFESMLEWASDRDADPDFVIVPDKVGDAKKTYERSRDWVDRLEFDTYQPIQDGMDIDEAVDFAMNTGSVGVFIGGSVPWKRKNAANIINVAHENGLKAHIGRPGGIKGILAADKWGADSVDTVSFKRNQTFSKLSQLEGQCELSYF